MKYNEMLNLSEVVGEGFFADRVVNLLEKRQTLASDDEKLLREVLNFIAKAKKGKRQVESGRLSSDALDSIGAYHRAIRIITIHSIEEGLTRPIRQAFQEMLGQIKSEVQLTIKDKMINPDSIKTTTNFFKLVGQQTSSEASRYYSKKVEVLSWPNLLY